jgi:membrane protein YdbS with pleckstrin-like domain
VTQSYVEDSMKEKLERIWTDKTPDHLDPDVKRYWRWLGLIIINIYLIPLFFVPISIVYSVGLCIATYVIIIGISGFLLYLYTYLFYETYTFLLADDMILIEKGVIWKRKNVIPYSRVQNVNITHNPLERALGIATVHIHTAGMGMAYAEGKVAGIPFPDELSEIILRKVRMYKYGEGLGDEYLGKDIDRFLYKFREYLITNSKE